MESNAVPPPWDESGVTPEPSTDEALLDAVRSGDSNAYGELYQRHHGAVLAVARMHTRNTSDAEDLVSEAFTRTFSLLKDGGGPRQFLRAYLVTAVSRLAADRANDLTRTRPEDPQPQGALDRVQLFEDTVVRQVDSAVVARAFASLPERWQEVLWYLEIEGRRPRQVASAVGIQPNAVSALGKRAREGLRTAYVQEHVSAQALEECQDFSPQLGAFARGTLTAGKARRMQQHLDDCRRCTAEYLQLQDLGVGLRGWILPVLAGLPLWGSASDRLVAWLSGAGAAGAGATSLFGGDQAAHAAELAATSGGRAASTGTMSSSGGAATTEAGAGATGHASAGSATAGPGAGAASGGGLSTSGGAVTAASAATAGAAGAGALGVGAKVALVAAGVLLAGGGTAGLIAASQHQEHTPSPAAAHSEHPGGSTATGGASGDPATSSSSSGPPGQDERASVSSLGSRMIAPPPQETPAEGALAPSVARTPSSTDRHAPETPEVSADPGAGRSAPTAGPVQPVPGISDPAVPPVPVTPGPVVTHAPSAPAPADGNHGSGTAPDEGEQGPGTAPGQGDHGPGPDPRPGGGSPTDPPRPTTEPEPEHPHEGGHEDPGKGSDVEVPPGPEHPTPDGDGQHPPAGDRDVPGPGNGPGADPGTPPGTHPWPEWWPPGHDSWWWHPGPHSGGHPHGHATP